LSLFRVVHACMQHVYISLQHTPPAGQKCSFGPEGGAEIAAQHQVPNLSRNEQLPLPYQSLTLTALPSQVVSAILAMRRTFARPSVSSILANQSYPVTSPLARALPVLRSCRRPDQPFLPDLILSPWAAPKCARNCALAPRSQNGTTTRRIFFRTSLPSHVGCRAARQYPSQQPGKIQTNPTRFSMEPQPPQPQPQPWFYALGLLNPCEKLPRLKVVREPSKLVLRESSVSMEHTKFSRCPVLHTN
jgi:hypothetical protein